jgi:hypothetical protein
MIKDLFTRPQYVYRIIHHWEHTELPPISRLMFLIPNQLRFNIRWYFQKLALKHDDN